MCDDDFLGNPNREKIGELFSFHQPVRRFYVLTVPCIFPRCVNRKNCLYFHPNLLGGKMKPNPFLTGLRLGASFSETFGGKQKHPPTELDKTSRSFTLMFLSVRTRQSQLKNLLDAADTPRRCPGKAEEISRDVHNMKILQFCWENKTCFPGHNLNQQQLRCWDKKGGTCQKET